jgi:hypothetical protein
MESSEGQDVQQTIEHARQAYQDGRMVFVARIVSKRNWNTHVAWDAAGLIECVEREGWLLGHISESLYGNGAAQMACVFRRNDG